jgi:hypothetical protein
MRRAYNDNCPKCGALRVSNVDSYSEAHFLDKQKFIWKESRCGRCSQRYVHFVYSENFRTSWPKRDEIIVPECRIKYLEKRPSHFKKATLIYLYSPILSERELAIESCWRYLSSSKALGKVILIDWETGESKCSATSLWEQCHDVTILPDSVFAGSIGKTHPSFLAERIVLAEAGQFPTADLIAVYPTINEGFLSLDYSKDKVSTIWEDERIEHFFSVWSRIPAEKEIYVGVTEK